MVYGFGYCLRESRMRNRRPIQLELRPRMHGGKRENAGRKRTSRFAPHVRRPELAARHPVHVTLRLVSGLPSLRTKSMFGEVKRALSAVSDRLGMRVVHYSVQTNHLHLLVEAEDRDALGRAMKGLQVRLARLINRIAGRRGRVFGDRYHAHVLKTPRQVRNALAYVLNNAKKHAAQCGQTRAASWFDPCSTARRFFVEGLGLRAARTWLLGVGWQRWGPISPAFVPARR